MFIEFPYGEQKIILNSAHIVSILCIERQCSIQVTCSNGDFWDFELSKTEFITLQKRLNK